MTSEEWLACVEDAAKAPMTVISDPAEMAKVVALMKSAGGGAGG